MPVYLYLTLNISTKLELYQLRLIQPILMMYKSLRRWFDHVTSKRFSLSIFQLNFDCKIPYVLSDTFLFECQ